MPLFFALGADLAAAVILLGLLAYLYRVAGSRALWGAVQYGAGHLFYTAGSMAAEALEPRVAASAGPVLWAATLATSIAVSGGALAMLRGVCRLFDYRPPRWLARGSEGLALLTLVVPPMFGRGIGLALDALDIVHVLLMGTLCLFMLFVRRPPYRGPALLVSAASGLLMVLYVAEAALSKLQPDSAWLANYEAWVALDVALWMTISYAFLILASFRAMRAFIRSSREDPLTRALNRLGLESAAEKMRTHARRGDPLAVLMVDIDHFKRVNDIHLHAGGDKVLQAFAGILAACVRRSDIVARVGGEEFVVLMPGASAAAARRVAELIRERTEATDIPLDTGDVRITTSVGIALGRADEPLDPIMRRADAALYDAKSKGRNRVEASPEANGEDALTR